MRRFYHPPLQGVWERWFVDGEPHYRLNEDGHASEESTTLRPTDGRDIVSINQPIREKKMRGLFRVFIVDPETDEILYQGDHIATDSSTAKMRAVGKAGPIEKDLDDLDVIAVQLGNVRAKEEVQSTLLNRTMLSYITKEQRNPKQLKPADEHDG